MPKKPARNPFWYFMQDWKHRKESQGETFPNGFADVQASPECSDTWKAMSPEQKQYYVNKAKSGKMVAMQAKIANNQAKTLQDIAKEEHEFKLNMDAHIRDIVFQAKRYNSITVRALQAPRSQNAASAIFADVGDLTIIKHR